MRGYRSFMDLFATCTEKNMRSMWPGDASDLIVHHRSQMVSWLHRYAIADFKVGRRVVQFQFSEFRFSGAGVSVEKKKMDGDLVSDLLVFFISPSVVESSAICRLAVNFLSGEFISEDSIDAISRFE